MTLSPNLIALGEFKPSDQWQTHVNSIFYGIKGPEIHNHFQTYVSLDHRLAHALAEDFFRDTVGKNPKGSVWTIQEWGVGNGNLAACFLSRLQEIDFNQQVYPFTHYILCDESEEILKGTRANPRLHQHQGRYSTVRVDAENLNCFESKSVTKIISNEIWDDLATKVVLKNENQFYEEYLCPYLPADFLNVDETTFLNQFQNKDLDGLTQLPWFLDAIHWERDFQRVDLNDWPFSKPLINHCHNLADGIPMPINIGAFAALRKAKELLVEDSLGYTGFDYGMLEFKDLNHEGRPYFNLYGGQYTFMVNFPLLEEVGREIGLSEVHKEYQNEYVKRSLESEVVGVVDLVQNHPQVAQMPGWDRDILMLRTLQALNSVYHSPYSGKLEYPSMPGTPKKQRKLISQLAKSLSARGVPDTVAYVTKEEVFTALKPLRKLGYREKDLSASFQSPPPPVSFIHIKFKD